MLEGIQGSALRQGSISSEALWRNDASRPAVGWHSAVCAGYMRCGVCSGSPGPLAGVVVRGPLPCAPLLPAGRDRTTGTATCDCVPGRPQRSPSHRRDWRRVHNTIPPHSLVVLELHGGVDAADHAVDVAELARLARLHLFRRRRRTCTCACVLVKRPRDTASAPEAGPANKLPRDNVGSMLGAPACCLTAKAHARVLKVAGCSLACAAEDPVAARGAHLAGAGA